MQFSEIIGQSDVINRLISAVERGRVSHAQLFLGPQGSGNLALAIAYAQYLNCSNKISSPEAGIHGDSCGECNSCKKYARLIHPDLHFIYPVSTTKKITKNPGSRQFLEDWRNLLLPSNFYVSLNDWYREIGIERKQGIINAEDCSEILRTLSYKSYENEYKVMIIWMVEKFFHAAAPKILKILEEPPDKTIFILVAEHSDQIINTIISRTQIVRIPVIDDESMLAALSEKFPGKNLRDIMHAAKGNIREAVRLVNEEQYDKEIFEMFRQWMRLCFQLNIASINELSGQLSRNGREWHKLFFMFGLKLSRECVHYNNLGKVSSAVLPDEQSFVKKFSPYLHNHKSIAYYKLINNALFQVERNANFNVLFLDLSLKIHSLLKA